MSMLRNAKKLKKRNVVTTRFEQKSLEQDKISRR
jgi:hypothetical protein